MKDLEVAAAAFDKLSETQLAEVATAAAAAAVGARKADEALRAVA